VQRYEAAVTFLRPVASNFCVPEVPEQKFNIDLQAGTGSWYDNKTAMETTVPRPTETTTSVCSVVTPEIVTATLHLLLPVARVGQPNKQQLINLCSFMQHGQSLERLSAADKEWIHLNGCVKGKPLSALLGKIQNRHG